MDPAEFRRVGRAAIDLLAEHLASIEERPLFPQAQPRDVRALFDEPLPQSGASAEEILGRLEAQLLPNCTQVAHPGYMGLITPTPTPIAAIGDLIASVLNQNIGTYSLGPGAIEIERRTVQWLIDLVGWGVGAGGHLTSGGTMANVEGLKLARDFASGDRAQHEGAGGPWAVYMSDQRQVSLDKAVDVVGVGRDALRAIPTDDDYRIDLAALDDAIRRDRTRGVRPMAIVAMAGTTNTGSVDDLAALRRIADREGAWLHADAAYGGGLLLSPAHRHVLAGLELADSITVDPHKWFFAPVDAGAILVRDEARLRASYGLRPPYLTDEFDHAGERFQYFVQSMEQSRRFRGLKVWMSFQRYGARQIGQWIEGNVAQAARFYERVRASDCFRAACRPVMSAVCVRYEPPGRTLDEDEIGRIHHEVARRIESEGRFWFGTTLMKGRWWFRINPVNFRTRFSDMDELFEALERHCGAVGR